MTSFVPNTDVSSFSSLIIRISYLQYLEVFRHPQWEYHCFLQKPLCFIQSRNIIPSHPWISIQYFFFKTSSQLGIRPVILSFWLNASYSILIVVKKDAVNIIKNLKSQLNTNRVKQFLHRVATPTALKNYMLLSCMVTEFYIAVKSTAFILNLIYNQFGLAERRLNII